MEQFLTIVGGLIGLVVLVYFFSTCHDIEAIRKKIAPSPKQMLKEAEVEFKIGNRDVAEQIAKRVLATVGEKSCLGKKAQQLIKDCNTVVFNVKL